MLNQYPFTTYYSILGNSLSNSLVYNVIESWIEVLIIVKHLY